MLPPTDIFLRMALLTSLRDTASVKCSRSQDQANCVSKPGLHQLPRDPSLPKGTTQEGLVGTKPTPSSPINVEDRLVQAQDLAYFLKLT